MTNPQIPFEVEIRCHFDSPDEAYATLPFLKANLRQERGWTAAFYGLEFFQSGKLLRVAGDIYSNESRSFLGWKGPDTGKFANIRQEMDEEITCGITDSSILKTLGGRTSFAGKPEVVRELERLGFHRFMSFEGADLRGEHEPLGIGLKLMRCDALKWPLLVELEKMASTSEEAILAEKALFEISQQYNLQSRLLRDEPPTLLYQALHPSK
jgi:adenylate cyclase class IV